jgi:hypothetical protein
MTFEEVREELATIDEEIILFDGYEDALIGYVERFNECGHHVLVALYDRAACIRILMKRDGMVREEAEEFFEFNTAGTYCGETNPAFATLLRHP